MALCQVCASAVAERSCPLCGAAVCPDHFRDGAELCVDCADAGGQDAGPGAGGRR